MLKYFLYRVGAGYFMRFAKGVRIRPTNVEICDFHQGKCIVGIGGGGVGFKYR